jgi:hypothetical protein
MANIYDGPQSNMCTAKKYSPIRASLNSMLKKLVCIAGWVLALAKLGQDIKVTKVLDFHKTRHISQSRV